MATESLQTNASIRNLLRVARQDAHLSQQRAAARAGVSPTWWKKVESSGEVTVTEDTLLRMYQAVNVTPRHLRAIGYPALAEMLAERLRFAETAQDYHLDGTEAESLEEYLLRAPASPGVRKVLISVARSLRSADGDRRREPFADFPATPRR